MQISPLAKMYVDSVKSRKELEAADYVRGTLPLPTRPTRVVSSHYEQPYVEPKKFVEPKGIIGKMMLDKSIYHAMRQNQWNKGGKK